MKWVTRARPKTDRIACPWLIRRFIDPEAEILYARKDEVLGVAAAEGAHSFDAPGARYDHRDGLCTFEVLIEDYDLGADPALARLAKIVHAADVSEDIDTAPEGPGLKAIAHGFSLLLGAEDGKKIELETPMYDALYAWCLKRVETTPCSGL